ncbi:MAG: twin-arginine translocase TatA/TatE family subunit [Brevefilum sp.]
MFKTIGLPEILIVLVIVLLVFGVGRIAQLGGELGKGIRAFKEGLSGEKDEDQHSESQDNTEE